MSNFSGIKKSAKPFQPQGSGAPDVGIVRNVAGGYEPMQFVEVKKANEPVLPTDEPRPTDGKGESELNLSGQVDHPDNSGSAKYLAGKIARAYRQIVAPVGGIENLSVEQRRQMREELVRRVGATADGAQQLQGDSESAVSARAEVWELANLLFGLIDELSGTPDFLRAPKPPTPDSDRVGRIGSDYLRLKAEPTGTLLKSFGQGVTVYCRILHKNDALREVHGVIAEELPDKVNEILDFASSEPYFRKWSDDAAERTRAAGLPVSYGNVREQHSPRAVGKLTDIQFDSANKRIPVVAKIVDDDTWRKIQAGVLTGFSIGGSYLNKWADGNYIRYTAKPAEVSIVDNPCMPGATFSMVKDAPTDFDKIVADLHKTTEVLTARVKAMLEAQGANLDELAPTKFKTMHEWREACAKAALAKALANGKAPEFEGGNVKSGFQPLGTGEQPTGAKKSHYADMPVEQQRKPFQPRG